MWCYQIPQFEAHVISKLQKQQQCSQFCDTLLKAEGVSVPAHSWILAAFSPCISSALASTAPPPAGFTQLLEFGAFGACSLFHMVQLLYSGKMMGEGEKEKQEAFSAAARLGIHGLVEVTRTDRKQRNQQEVREVGVQTEPEETVEDRLRRGSFPPRQLQMVSASGVGLDMWTEGIEAKQFPPLPELAASYQTLDVSALQMGTYQDSLHMIPISLIYPPDENQPSQPFSHWSPSEFTVPQPNTSVPSLPQPRISGPDAGLAITPLPVTGEALDKHLEQCEGNISWFISDLLNLNREGSAHERRPQGRRQRGTSERKPPGGLRVKRQGLLTQIVDVQQVWVVSRQHKLFMHRTRWSSCPKGQGGGAVGGRMHLKTRALLNTSTSQPRTKVRRKVWEVSPSGDLRLRRGRSSTAELKKQDNLPASLGERSKAKSTVTTTVSTRPVQTCDAPAPPVSCPVLQLSPSTLHFLQPLLTPLSPDQPQCINHLLEKVTMGQEIQPNTDQLPSGTRSSTSISSVGNVAPDHPQGVSLQRSTEAVNGLNRGACFSLDHEEDVPLQQECEGEMNQILEKFLQSFEQHIDCAREESDAGGISSIFTSVFESSLTTSLPPCPRATAPQRDERQQSSSLPHHEPNDTPARSLTKRGPQNTQLLEKMLKDRNMRVNKDKLRLNPVVKVERIKVMPVRATRVGLDRPSLRDKGDGGSERKPFKAKRPPTANRPRRQVGVHRRNRRVESKGDVQPVGGQSKSTEKSEITPKQAKKRERKRKLVSAKKICFDQRYSPADATAMEPNCKREQSTDKKSNQDEEVGHTDTDTDTLPASVSTSADVKTLPDLMVESAGNQQRDDDDVDVVTAASPAPSPVFCLVEPSAGEEEEEDIDVVG